jgi:cystathionine beta-synthase
MCRWSWDCQIQNKLYVLKNAGGLISKIGYDLVPEVLNQAEPDLWIKTSDQDSFQYARRLVREEGLLCGGSSGATIAALTQVVEARPELNKQDKLFVVILPDSLRNYLTKFANDDWMAEHGYSLG